MTLSNIFKCRLCDNVDLVILWISRVLGTRRQCITVFPKKNIEQNKCEMGESFQRKLDKTEDLLHRQNP